MSAFFAPAVCHIGDYLEVYLTLRLGTFLEFQADVPLLGKTLQRAPGLSLPQLVSFPNISSKHENGEEAHARSRLLACSRHGYDLFDSKDLWSVTGLCGFPVG